MNAPDVFKPVPQARREPCAKCSSQGWIVQDVPEGDPRFGQLVRCPACSKKRLADASGLNERELALTPQAIKGGSAPYVFLRAVLADVLERPHGLLTLWGTWGTAKTLFAQIVVAEMIRRGTEARFERAVEIEQRWFRSMHGDEDGDLTGTYRTIPVRVLDEGEKVNMRSPWTLARWEAFHDAAYRDALAERTLVILTLNADPLGGALPGATASRLTDGRFCREVPPGMPLEYTPEDEAGNPLPPVTFTVERWGRQVIPGVIHVAGQDARPYIRPGFIGG